MAGESKDSWLSYDSTGAMEILKAAHESGRPVVLLAGAGISVDSGFPLTPQLKDYLVQVNQFALDNNYSNVPQYIEEARWPSRHDLQLELNYNAYDLGVNDKLRRHFWWRDMIKDAERRATQMSLTEELRHTAPTLASSLQEIFGQIHESSEDRKKELVRTYGELGSLARQLGVRSPRTIAFRSLLFTLCDNNQATIDACFDHFTRDRYFTTTHQFMYFFTQLLRSKIIFTTNFDPLLEHAFLNEGMIPRVYEIQGDGTIPSAKLLLSQPLSIVKLHGGAHQMKTGFDLDDPLSPKARASFTDLYHELAHGANNQQPLTVVMGNSGSDRRIMDILTDRIHRWEPSNTDNKYAKVSVLWISRDPWTPNLLKSAIETHRVVYGNNGADKGYPAHVVRYRDVRLFLLEAIQRLQHNFPIARSYYQVVNTVPHSAVAEMSAVTTPEIKDDDWRMALVHSAGVTGSSSTLIKIAEKLEREDYRVIWIDLTEVSGIAGLIDMISEQITKLDSRLQKARRPVLLQSIMTGLDKKLNHERYSENSERHEILIAAQWIRHALRRNRYLLALDSLDEFPNRHPALQDAKGDKYEVTQRTLFLRLAQILLKDPQLIGDSRIVVALTTPGTKEDPSAQPICPRIYTDSKILPQFYENDYSLHGLSREQCDALVKCYKKPRPQELLSSNGELHHVNFYGTLKQLGNKDRVISTAILIIACCSRRIRSEAFLCRAVSELIGCMKYINHICTTDIVNQEGRVFNFESMSTGVKTIIADAPEGTEQHKSNTSNDIYYRDILDNILRLCGTTVSRSDSDKSANNGASNKYQWLHRIEGGYHWMHRDARDGLYRSLYKVDKAEDKHNRQVLMAAHHAAAIISYDEIYERSRDARAFLEYFFQRMASIKLAIDLEEYGCAIAWAQRLIVALHREKHELMTRARLPNLIHLMLQLHDLILKLKPEDVQKRIDKLLRKTKTEKRTKEIEKLEKDIPILEQDKAPLQQDLLGFMSEFLLASGHPHTAGVAAFSRLGIAYQAPIKFPVSGNAQHDVANQWIRLMKIDRDTSSLPLTRPMKALRDFAYTIHDPLLSHSPFPRLKSGDMTKFISVDEVEAGKDWYDSYRLKEDGITPITRQTTLALAARAYNKLREFRSDDNVDKALKGVRLSGNDDLLNFFGSTIRPQQEYELLRYPETWIASSIAYLDTPGDEGDRLAEDIREYCEDQIKSRNNLPALNKTDTEMNGEVPLLRKSAQRLRHESRRLCLTARIEAADLFLIKKDTCLNNKCLEEFAQNLLNPNGKWQNSIRRPLADAEAILNRAMNPENMQTMAITRLTVAELLVRRAEFLWWISQKADKKFDPPPKKLEQESFQSLEEAFATLSTVESLMNKGRGENRWRFFYLLTFGRAHLLLAKINHEAQRTALRHMYWAGRHIVGAMTNCGMWTDRYDVLLWWWGTWQYVAKTLFREDLEGYIKYVKRMKAILGIQWDKEDAPRPKDRFSF